MLLQIKIGSLRYSMIFLVNVGFNLASRIPNRKRPFKRYLRMSVVNSIFINPVQESEIDKLINNLGPCSIPVKILQNHVDILKQPLIINLSLQQGIFPEALKTARVTPIFKKVSPRLPYNYRPISVL